MHSSEMDAEVLISLDGLAKSFGRQVVLENVNLEIRKGETMVILGQSGGGKSVILKHMIGLLQPSGGSVSVGGKVIAEPGFLDVRTIRDKMAMVFQMGALFDSMDTGENIAFPLRERRPELSEEEIERRVVKNLEMINLKPEFRFKMPAELSGGMRKRVALARAIALEPEIVLYDEPTTGLDPITSDVINDLIIDMKRKLGVTSVVVTHDMVSAYKVADRIAMLHDGVIIACGTPEEIRESTNPYLRQFITGKRTLPTEEELAYPAPIPTGGGA